MTQQQHAADVHPDELCPPNKRYDLMDANKKVVLEHVQCPPESKILTNIIKNNPLRFSIAASSSVPWIYMVQFWHTLKEDGLKYQLRFMLDKTELTLTLDDFRQIFYLPQATANNHNSFVPPPSLSDIVPFYKLVLGFIMSLQTHSNSRQLSFCSPCENVMQNILQMLNNTRARDKYHNLQDDDIMKNIFKSGRHKDKVGMQIPALMITEEMTHTEHYRMYTEVFGIEVPLTQSLPTESTQGTHRTPSAPRSPNPNKEVAESSAPRRSTMIHLRIPERRSTRLTPPAPVPNVDKADKMILQDTLQVSLVEHKSHGVRTRERCYDSSIIGNDELKLSRHYERAKSDKESPEVEIAKEKEVEISKEKEVELTKEMEVEITQETPVVNITNVVIPVNVNDENEEITDEVYELKRREKGKIVEETRNSPIPTPIRSPRIHTNLVSSDTEKLQELTDTHTTPSSSSPHKKLTKTNRLLSLFKTKPTRFKRYKSFFHELQGRYGYLFAHLRARFMPRKSFDTLADNLHDVMVETLPTIVDKHVKKQVMQQVPEQVRNQVPVYVAEGLILERQKAKEETERLIAKAILQERGNIQAQISTQIENAIANVIPSQVDASVRNYMSGHILHVHPAQSQTSSVPEQQYQLYLAMKADPQLQQQDIAIWLALQMKFERNTVLQTACRTPAVRPRDQDDPHDDAHPEGENSAKRQKTSEYEAYVSGESSSGQVFQEEQAPSTSGNQEQDDDFDFWTDSYASDDDEIPTKQVSQDIMEEVSLTIDEAKLRKMADEMLRQRCTSGDEHQYHIDQMKNFLKSDIVWESRKEILVSPHPQKTTPLVHSCQRDPKAPALSLINQDLLYLKKGNYGPEKIVLSLHKFPVVIFNDDDIEERTSRWVNKKQKEPGKPKEEVYSNSKIIQVVKTYWELGHEHKFITKIIARRANKYLVSITEPGYKNLNKNDIEDIYLLIMNGKEIPTPTAFQTNDLDAFDSDCVEAPYASVVLIAKLSSYDSETLSEVPTHENYLDNHVIDQTVQGIQYSEQPIFDNDTDIENDITSESNMISYEQYLNETKYTVVQYTSSSVQHKSMIMFIIEEMSNQVAKCNKVDKENKMINESLIAELERYKEQIKLFEERQQFDLNDKEMYIDGQLKKVITDKNTKVADFENQIHSLKQQLNKIVESHKTLSTTVDVLKMESKAKEYKYLDKIIDLEKKIKALDNVIYKMGQSMQTMHMLTKP
ncbi:hypothetical protein Tco_0954255 [Tanacetum coccineum]|uniref:Uncharacterized protein n=1 Tax=Tanacetum coccineum TaxID=301880 RepID=A0ABQ5E287_9ASTR